MEITHGEITLINGPNLNRLGVREPGIYGTATLEDIEGNTIKSGQDLGFAVDCHQSNFEGELIDFLHNSDGNAGVIINPGALTHYSYALRDAIASISTPCVEVHISNIYAREEFRRHSVISPVVLGVISGFGIMGYDLALQVIARHVCKKSSL